MKFKLLIMLGIFLATVSIGQEPLKAHVKNGIEVNKLKCVDVSLMYVFLPYPQSDQYQTISNVKLEIGELVDIPESDQKCVRMELESADIPGKRKHLFQYEFDVEGKAIDFDFNEVSQIEAYDTSAIEYKRYTKSSGEYVDIENPKIIHLADSIWSASSDIINYAEKCYEFVASNYTYGNPYTGLHTLEEIFLDNGGDCGNLCSIYISLLRNKGIPARHVVAIIEQDKYHVWSEFYIENHGWIPVDVTYKRTDPEGDYFGKYDGKAIVVCKDVALKLERGELDFIDSSILQKYYYMYWLGKDCDGVSVEHKMNRTELK